MGRKHENRIVSDDGGRRERDKSAQSRADGQRSSSGSLETKILGEKNKRRKKSTIDTPELGMEQNSDKLKKNNHGSCSTDVNLSRLQEMVEDRGV